MTRIHPPAFAHPLAFALRTLVTLAIGAAGGWLASEASVPLPWMIGALLAVGAAALSGFTVVGHGVHVPQVLRNCMIPIVGVMIGGAFTPDVVEQVPDWWVTLIGLLVFMLTAAASIYLLYTRVFGYDPATAYFSAIPGGLIEMSVIGEDCGGDARTISLIHFCRIVIAVLAIPFVMRLIYGPVGSAALGTMHMGTIGGLADLALLVAAALAGALGGRALGIPGAFVSGPMLLSAVVHAGGFTQAVPPSWLIFTAQLVIGASLGARFAGVTLRQLGRVAVSAFTATAVMMAIGVALSLALVSFVPEPLTALILAYAPGGFAEMSLIALSLQIGVAFVAAHHMARIILAVLLMPAIWRRILAKRAGVPPRAAAKKAE